MITILVTVVSARNLLLIGGDPATWTPKIAYHEVCQDVPERLLPACDELIRKHQICDF